MENLRAARKSYDFRGNQTNPRATIKKFTTYANGRRVASRIQRRIFRVAVVYHLLAIVTGDIIHLVWPRESRSALGEIQFNLFLFPSERKTAARTRAHSGRRNTTRDKCVICWHFLLNINLRWCTCLLESCGLRFIAFSFNFMQIKISFCGKYRNIKDCDGLIGGISCNEFFSKGKHKGMSWYYQILHDIFHDKQNWLNAIYGWFYLEISIYWIHKWIPQAIIKFDNEIHRFANIRKHFLESWNLYCFQQCTKDEEEKSISRCWNPVFTNKTRRWCK